MDRSSSVGNVSFGFGNSDSFGDFTGMFTQNSLQLSNIPSSIGHNSASGLDHQSSDVGSSSHLDGLIDGVINALFNNPSHQNLRNQQQSSSKYNGSGKEGSPNTTEEDNSDSGSDGTNKDNKNLTKSFDRSVLPTDTVRQLLRAVLASKVSSGDNSNGNNKNIPNLNQQFQFSPVSGSSKPMPKQDDIKKDSEQGMEKKWSLSNIYANTRQISQDLLDIVATEKAVVD